MEQHEARLFDLLESTPYEALNPEELSYVSEYLTEDEYRAQQQLIEAAHAWEMDVDAEPLPLSLPQQKPSLGRSIPFYQTLLAIASVVIIFLVVKSFGETLPGEKPGTPLVQKEIVHDTVVQYITHVDTVIKRERLPAVIALGAIQKPIEVSGSRLPEVAGELTLPDLNEATIRNTGQSMREDETHQLIPTGRGW